MAWLRRVVGVAALFVAIFSLSHKPAAALTAEQEARLRAAIEAGTVQQTTAAIVAALAAEGVTPAEAFGQVLAVILESVADPRQAAALSLEAMEAALAHVRASGAPETEVRQAADTMGRRLVAVAAKNEAFARALFESARARAMAGVSPVAAIVAVALRDGLEAPELGTAERERLAQIASNVGFTQFVATLVQPAGGPPPVTPPRVTPPRPGGPLPGPTVPERGVASPS